MLLVASGRDKSRRELSGRKIVLRRYSECVGHAIEERKQRDHVNRFRDLLFAPARVSQPLDVFCRGTGGRMGNQLRVVEQHPFSGGQIGLIERTFHDGFDGFVRCSLNTQEVSVAVESIRTSIQIRDITCQHLLVAARQVSFRKMQRIGKLDELSKKIRSGAKTFEDAGNLLPPRSRSPEVVSGSSIPRCLLIFDDVDLRLWITDVHGSPNKPGMLRSKQRESARSGFPSPSPAFAWFLARQRARRLRLRFVPSANPVPRSAGAAAASSPSAVYSS